MIRHEAMKDYREILGKDKTSSIRQLLGITETKKFLPSTDTALKMESHA